MEGSALSPSLPALLNLPVNVLRSPGSNILKGHSQAGPEAKKYFRNNASEELPLYRFCKIPWYNDF